MQKTALNKKLAIIGAGDLGQLIAYHAITDNHYSSVIFFDDSIPENSFVDGHPVLGNIEKIESHFQNKTFDELFIGIGYKHIESRKKLFELFKNNIPFGKIVHSSSFVDKSSSIKQGCIIFPGCVLDKNVSLQENVLLNTGCIISHDSTIGPHSFISPAVVVAGLVSISECCIIGINTTIIDNVSIAPFSQTGGGTVVIDNIEKAGLYVGNPAKFIR